LKEVTVDKFFQKLVQLEHAAWELPRSSPRCKYTADQRSLTCLKNFDFWPDKVCAA